MAPYGFVIYTVVRGFSALIEDGQVGEKAKNFLNARTSLLKSWWRCFRKNCDYYQIYQAHGPADLTHVGYHAAERLALEHLANCATRSEGDCDVCQGWAARLRGELWELIMGGTRAEEGKKYGFH